MPNPRKKGKTKIKNPNKIQIAKPKEKAESAGGLEFDFGGGFVWKRSVWELRIGANASCTTRRGHHIYKTKFRNADEKTNERAVYSF